MYLLAVHGLGARPTQAAFLPPLPSGCSWDSQWGTLAGEGRTGGEWGACMTLVEILVALIFFPGPSFIFAMATRLQ